MNKIKKNKKKIFIGSDFIESQYYWLIPIVVGYCKKNHFEQVVFEKNNSALKDKNLNNLFKKLKIEIIILNKKNFHNTLRNFLVFLISSFISLIQVFFFNYKKINKSNSWNKIQYHHAIWDLSRNLSKDTNLIPSYIIIFKSFLICNIKLINSYFIANKFFSVCFIGHTVYSSRISLLTFRRFNSKIFAQANWNIYSLDKKYDRSWSMPNNSLLNQINSVINNKEIDLYWHRRLKGLSTYEDANISINLKPLQETKKSKNYILLHIFRDSPFNAIDNERIFIDYYDWITETLKILNFSKERWVLRTHPNCNRWGENSIIILKKIINKLNKKSFKLNNIEIEFDHISSNELFKNAEKIVTFSGTSHLEAACYGIKPIVISNCTLSDFETLCHKPKNISEYKRLLLEINKSNFFKLTEKDIMYCKRLIYVRENILTFRKELNSFNLYKADNMQLRKKELETIKKNIYLKLNYFLNLGQWLSYGNTQTISEEYLNKLLVK